jgi:transitional endoplasmic reticulum ATPase
MNKTELAVEVKKMMEAERLEAGNRFKNTDVSVEHKGTKIVLPSDPHDMSYREAISSLEMRMKEEETLVAVNEIIKSFPFDGAYAFMKAMKAIYGWATPVPTPGFFGPTPPNTVSLEIDYGVTTQIIWGDFKIPGLEGKLTTGVWQDDSGMMYFCIKGAVLKKHMKDVKKVADLTREIVAQHSIYRGKAIRLDCNKSGDVDFNKQPKFLDLSKVNPDELTYSQEVMEQITTNLFTPIEHTETCRKLRIPLKRGVLLQGPYGTGKTLAAFVTATKCVRNGWTFILLDKVSGLDGALTFARLYGPSVVFAEDIDRAVTGERSVAMDDILNTIDGIESKGAEVITILTSNHVENINQAMLRPGRLDAVIHVTAPDAKAAEKLVRIYARNTLVEGTDLTEAGRELDGKIPAVIREVVERAKLYAIGNGNFSNGEVRITGKDLAQAARGMKAHLDLLAPKNDVKSDAEVFYEAYGKLVAKNTPVEVLESKEVKNIHEVSQALYRRFDLDEHGATLQ